MRQIEEAEQYIRILQKENTKLHNENKQLKKELDKFRSGKFVAKNITVKEVKKND